jgi:phytoene desaturase
VSRRICIIGAGPGGLATAMLLAQAGAEVTVFEKSATVGGRSAGIDADTRAGRFRFDMGPTFFLYPRVLDDIFAACGREMKREIDLIRLDPQYDLIFESGGHIRATPDIERLQAEVARLSPHDAAALPRFMADNRKKLAAFRPVLEAAFHGWRDLIKPDMLKALPMMRPLRTVDSDLATYFSDERIRLAFSFQSKYLGMSPYRCPSLFTILSFMEYEFGVYHPRGGCGAVMEALARVAGEMGVKFRLGEPVQEILFAGKRANGVRTARGEFKADAVVVNADFAAAMQALVPDHLRRRWTDRKLAKKKFSCSTFMLYLGLEGVEDKLAHHTIYLSKEYKRNIAEIEAGAAPPTEPSFYVQNACVTDPDLAPPGHSTLYVLVPVGNRTGEGIDWAAEQAKFRAITLERLKQIGVRDVEKRIVFEKMLTPQGWEDEHAIHRGATFNLSHSLDQMLSFRPRNRFEDLDRVYLVGGGTHPGSGLPVIFEGARITSRLLADDLGIGGHWKRDSAMAAPDFTPVLAEAL